jgi:hypothetical protein
MKKAGFKSVRAEGVLTPFTFQSGEQYADMVLDVSGSSRELLAALPVSARKQFRSALVRGAEGHREGDVVRMPGFAWVVSAAR